MMVNVDSRKYRYHLWVTGVPKWIKRDDINEIGVIFKESRKMSIPDRMLSQKKEMAYSL